MALFKFRNGGDEQATPQPQPESVEAMRKRARHRLVGAALLVLAGVIGFPLLFDTQPRPIAVDIPIEIPDKNKTRPISIAASSAATAPAPESAAVPPVPTATPKVVDTTAKAAEPSPRLPEPKQTAIAPKLEEKEAVALSSPAAYAIKKEAKPNSREPAESTDGAKARALLEGNAVEQAAPVTEGRFVVQVGAFADATRAKEARTKLERAGMKTYTQVVETKDGQRTRVRVGPFTDKNDADKVASKIKALDLPAAILVL